MAAARREERLKTLQALLSAEDIALEFCSADVASAAAMEQLAQQALAKFGKIDILVYAAGTNTRDRAMTRLTADIWDRMVDVNLNGAYYITRAVLPSMRARLRSSHLRLFSFGIDARCFRRSLQAGKRGVVGLAHAIRVEEKENGIRTCAICPGLVDTEILVNRPVMPSPETLAKALQPEDVAEAILSIAKLPPRATVPELQLVPTYL